MSHQSSYCTAKFICEASWTLDKQWRLRETRASAKIAKSRQAITSRLGNTGQCQNCKLPHPILRVFLITIISTSGHKRYNSAFNAKFALQRKGIQQRLRKSIRSMQKMQEKHPRQQGCFLLKIPPFLMPDIICTWLLATTHYVRKI